MPPRPNVSAKQRAKRERGRTPWVARLPRPGEWWVLIPLAVYALLCLLLLRQPAQVLAFDAERYPPDVALRNFYGAERNAAGSYRWAKSGAFITLPAAAPGDYRITLLLGDTPASGGGRTARIYAGGAEVATAILRDQPQEVTFTYRYDPAAWARSDAANHDLNVELNTTPFTPPQDDRALGAIFYRATVEATPAPSALLLRLAPGWLVIGLAYLTLRLARWRPWRAALVPLLPSLALLGYATLDGRSALALTLRALLSPWPGLALVALPPLGYLLLRSALREPLPAPAGEEVFWSRRSLPLLAPLALAAGLRIDHLNHLSLWSDEGFTLWVAYRPWRAVLGLDGAYDSHPPLHFALVKALLPILPAASGGRILSAACGVLAVAALYALTARLAGRAAAFGAALVLAIEPLHIWYSQEARMYAPAALTVLLSYLAVAGYAQAQRHGQRWAWAACYAVSLAASMYLVYAALYAILPQLLLLGALAWRMRARIVPLIAGAAAAALAFAPWVPQLFRTTAGLGPYRAAYLGASPGAVRDTLITIIGLGGMSTGDSYYNGLWGSRQSWLLLAPIAPAFLLGAIALLRQFRWAAATAVALLAGTIGGAILLSLYSPGFAARTTLVAVFGWAVLVGAACIPCQPRWFMVAGRVLLVVSLVLPGLTWWRLRQEGYKHPSRPLALAAADVADLGQPFVVMDYIIPAFVAAYAPLLPYQPQSYLATLPSLPDPPGALWLVYAEWENVGQLMRDELRDAGYERVLHHTVGGSFFLDLFARQATTLGETIAAGDLRGPGANTWDLPLGSAWGTSDGVPDLAIRDDGREGRAWTVLPAAPQRLYTLELAVRASASQGQPLATIACQSATGTTLERATSRAVRLPAAASPASGAAGGWERWRVAVFCPRDTARTEVALEYRGSGEAHFRDLSVRELAGTGR